MKTTLELVHDLQALLSSPERWTKGSDARNAEGKRCDARSSLAVCWCIDGGVIAVSGHRHEPEARLTQLAIKAAPVPEYLNLFEWNDAPERTFSDIQALLIRMEALAQQEAP